MALLKVINKADYGLPHLHNPANCSCPHGSDKVEESVCPMYNGEEFKWGPKEVLVVDDKVANLLMPKFKELAIIKDSTLDTYVLQDTSGKCFEVQKDGLRAKLQDFRIEVPEATVPSETRDEALEHQQAVEASRDGPVALPDLPELPREIPPEIPPELPTMPTDEGKLQRPARSKARKRKSKPRKK